MKSGRAIRHRGRDLRSIFEEKIEFDTNGGCWLWSEYPSRGYGALRYGGRILRPQHVAFELSGGELQAGDRLLHSCGVAVCCNPAHLVVQRVADRPKRRHAKLQRQYARNRDRRPPGKTLLDRLLDKVEFDTNGGCWLWSGAANKQGYGHLNEDGRPQRVHRVMWKAVHGDLGDEILVLHRCDVPACLNPAHLFLGDHAANVADKVSKRRHVFGEQAYNAKLTSADVAAIRGDPRPQRQIAKAYGVGVMTINRIIKGRSWRY